MHFVQGQVYHVYNRGNNQQKIFFDERNYYFFIDKIKTHLLPACEILSWCLMPNYFHLLIYATDKSCFERPSFGGKPMQELPYQIGKLLSSYSQAINKQNKTTGSLFQQKTKAVCVSDQDARIVSCAHYIHRNPLKAGLVIKMEDWKFSSFRGYKGMKVVLECNYDRLLSITGCEREQFSAGQAAEGGLTDSMDYRE